MWISIYGKELKIHAKFLLRFEVFMAMTVKNAVFWDVTP
jgi:hypothetical protein